MKKAQVFSTALLMSFLLVLLGCTKSQIQCRTCTARYNGSTIASEQACSAQAEADFKTEYYYAEPSCK